AAAPGEHAEAEEEERDLHRMSSCTVLTSRPPSCESSALASLPSPPGGSATLSQKPSFTALRNASLSNTAWYGCGRRISASSRSEEHTSKLQSPDHLVCRLL